MSGSSFTVAVAVNNREILQNNLLLSPELAGVHSHQIIVREGYASAALAYNSAIEQAVNDVIMFVHQDVYFPDHWFAGLERAIREFDKQGIRWGVLGCFGNRLDSQSGIGAVYTTGRGVHGKLIDAAEAVETLDEIVLVIRKSSGLRFDGNLPGYHLYGTDICMTARSMSLANFVVPGFCVHNTNEILQLPAEFMSNYYYIKRKWVEHLPIRTSCITISQFDREFCLVQLRTVMSRLFGKTRVPKSRVNDPRCLLDKDCLPVGDLNLSHCAE
jgi:hypothetical protein